MWDYIIFWMSRTFADMLLWIGGLFFIVVIIIHIWGFQWFRDWMLWSSRAKYKISTIQRHLSNDFRPRFDVIYPGAKHSVSEERYSEFILNRMIAKRMVEQQRFPDGKLMVRRYPKIRRSV